MAGIKIFNDPVYGFIDVPKGIILDLIDHPWFQRLRRIKQTGMASYVYPGALHTRFHHALGALHLMQQAVAVLKRKGVRISDEEREAVCIAILLHDIGHGPFSHALEHKLVDLHHEDISLMLMQRLNQEFKGALDLAIRIFSDMYERKFLHQMVSGQLDMDRMDYLNRDSFYTGVTEGMIGYDRIIKMLNVVDNQLVVEEKGIYSIEKFLMARRFMFLQVYAHKTSLSAEQMLMTLFTRARHLAKNGVELTGTPWLEQLFVLAEHGTEDEILDRFVMLDDADVTVALKLWTQHKDKFLSYLSSCLTHRRLFRLEWHKKPLSADAFEQIVRRLEGALRSKDLAREFVFTGLQEIKTYDPAREQIMISYKDGSVMAIENIADVQLYTTQHSRYFVAYPKVHENF